MPRTHATPSGTVALLPGSGSTGDFLARAFAPVIGDSDTVVITHKSGDARKIAGELTKAWDSADARTAPITCVIGVSIGAHAAAWWACGRSDHTPANQASDVGPASVADTELVLAMPAWSGPPESIAGVTALAADRLAEVGVAAELAALHAEFPHDWVVTELDSAWRTRNLEQLVTSLRGTAASYSPTPADLARISQPTCVVALADDPLHPMAVAREWATAIPGATLATVARDTPAVDRAVFGQAVLTAWAVRQLTESQ